jgi:serine/threonine protein kinase
MLLDCPYNSSIDWWQLGIITFQMITRTSPFRGDNEDEIYDSILADEPEFPTSMEMTTIDFIWKLLNKEPERRLGTGTNGADQVMGHPFFSETKWDDLYHKRVPSPFIPTVVHRTDVSNFDSEFTRLDTQAKIDTSESKLCLRKLSIGRYLLMNDASVNARGARNVPRVRVFCRMKSTNLRTEDNTLSTLCSVINLSLGAGIACINHLG